MQTTILKALVLAIVLLPAMSMAQERFTIRGKVGKLNAPAKVYLGYAVDNKYMIRDSAIIKKGWFQFEGVVKEPTSAVLIIRHDRSTTPTYRLKDHYNFYLEKANITFTAKDSIRHAAVAGSPLTLDNNELTAQLEPITAAIDGMHRKWTGVKPTGPDDKAYYKAADSLKGLLASLKNVQLDFAASHRHSYIGLLAFGRMGLKPNFDPVSAEVAFNEFADSVKATSEGKRVFEQIQKARKSQVGIVLVDFTQNDVNDKPVKLSDFRGRYVLVDFWASWCGPCRAENPNMKSAYEKLKGDKFEIIGVSLDESKKSWLYAIEKDGLPWINVSDLKGWKNEVALTFGISSVPQNYLIDPKGVVIARNLRGEDLYEKLQELIK